MSATYIVVVFPFSRKLSSLDLIAFEQQFSGVVMLLDDTSWFIMMFKSRDTEGKKLLRQS